MSLILLAAAATPLLYHALGTEPFWSVTITQRAIRLERPDTPPLVVRRPPARVTRKGRRYATRKITVEIVRARCSDGMSDRLYPDTVTVRLRHTTLHGCGGRAIAP